MSTHKPHLLEISRNHNNFNTNFFSFKQSSLIEWKGVSTILWQNKHSVNSDQTVQVFNSLH